MYNSLRVPLGDGANILFLYFSLDYGSFDVEKLKSMKKAELQKLCGFHNLQNKGNKGLLIIRLKSFAAGEYVDIPEREPEPELPMDELIEKMLKESETFEMSTSEREGAYYHAGFVGKNDPNLTKKTREISNFDGFVPSKWIKLRSKGGLSLSNLDYSKDFDKMEIVFKAFHYYSKDGLHRFPNVSKKLTIILAQKFPNYEEKLLQTFSRSRTIFRMRNMQRHQCGFQFLSFFGQKLSMQDLWSLFLSPYFQIPDVKCLGTNF